MNDNIAKLNAELDAKWGDVIKGSGGGWTAVPNFLLKMQSELGLKPLELNVLINLIRFWWVPETAPFPSPEKIAQEIGVTERTIYRTLSSLEENGFIKRINESGKATQYELIGLVDKLKALKNTV
jgi:predicted transcriptional regulator